MNLWPPELKQMLTPETQVQLLTMTEADLDAVVAVNNRHTATLGHWEISKMP